MKSKIASWLSGLFAMAVAAVGMGQEPSRPAEPPPTINLRRTVTVDVVRKTKDAVVYISAKKLVARRMSPFANDPFLRDFPGFSQVVQVPANALGSGFLVHPDGYVITNNHVIDRAREIKVQLADGQSLDAELISSDPEADLAVLKVSADKPLPSLTLGDSQDLMIGEPVIAVGNPLGYSHSVSTGIVSAVHRDLKTGDERNDLTDLIQTDAAINPGNSGGPLLNAYGQVIGINTAIRGDAQNIGFAIQINKLRDLIPALLNPTQAGKLDLPVKLAEKRDMVEPSTVNSQVSVVEEDGKKLAIATINGNKPKDIIDAYAMLLKMKVGSVLTIKLVDGAERKLTAKALATPEGIVLAKKRLGVTVEALTPMVAQKYNMTMEEGILITEVNKGSLAERSGLQAGDVIVQVGRYRAATMNDFGVLLQHVPESGRVPFGIYRGQDSGLVWLEFGERKRSST